MKENYIRQVVVYGQHFWTFYYSQPKDVQKKIDWTIGLVRSLYMIPEKFFKHVEGSKGLFEIRVKCGRKSFRIFCCYDSGNLIILLSGFHKKSERAPKEEIERAEKLKCQYEEDKKERKGG